MRLIVRTAVEVYGARRPRIRRVPVWGGRGGRRHRRGSARGRRCRTYLQRPPDDSCPPHLLAVPRRRGQRHAGSGRTVQQRGTARQQQSKLLGHGDARVRRAELRVAGADSSAQWPVRGEASPTATRGRGLILVDAIVDKWGAQLAACGGGKSVWFTPAFGNDAS